MNSRYYKIIGDNVAYYRKKKNLTQEGLALKANISRTHISHIEAENVRKASYAHRDTIMSAINKSALFHPASELANNLGAVIITAVGGIMAFNHAMDASEIVAFLMYINMLYRPVNMLGRLSEDLQNSLAAADRVYELFDTESERQGRCIGNRNR